METYSIPYGVGGRFSVFTEVGFVTAALVGFDIEGFLAGAASMDAACQEEDIFKNPALLSALLNILRLNDTVVLLRCLCHIVTRFTLYPTGMCSFYLNRLVR